MDGLGIHRRRLANLPSFSPSTPTTDTIAIHELDTRDASFSSTGSAASPADTIAPYATALNGVNQPVNDLLKDIMWWSLGIICLFILCVRLGQLAWAQLRHVSAMPLDGKKQSYWKRAQWARMAWLKKHLTYAPIWKKRHTKEIRLSSAINVGTLPTRLQLVLLMLYIMSNVAYMFILNWSNENRYALLAEVRGRSGMIGAANLVVAVLLAARNNPLIAWLQISFDTFNLFHRWIGRLAAIESIIHTIAWVIVQHAAGGWESIWRRITGETFIASGVIGTLAFVIIIIVSVSPLRHAFYETFLVFHIILAFIAIVGTWVHCAAAHMPGGLPQLSWMVAIFIIWMLERTVRMLRLAYYNWSSRGWSSEALVEPLPCNATRVTIALPRYVDVKPGTHAYIRISGLSVWENHPFSIAWVEHKPIRGSLPITEKQELVRTSAANMRTKVSFIIGAQTGFTKKLHDKAQLVGRPSTMGAYFEGPYAGHHSLNSYGHAVLIAGATGITHQLSYLKPLIEGFNNGTVATRRIVLVWIIRDMEALEWIRPYMDEILRLPRRREILQIQLYITRPKLGTQVASASETVQMFVGRPNITSLLTREVGSQIGAMAVSVCGPGALADDVRSAVRQVQDEGTVVDFVHEAFTW